jgi:anaerobic selenocysteine-containing dehydrogenase
VQFVDVFPQTPDRRIDLFPQALAAEAAEGLYTFRPEPADERHPLALISPASSKSISSTLGELRTAPAALHMHPQDAEQRGIEQDDTVRIFNDLGDVHCPVTLDPDVLPGTVSLSKGVWRQHTLNGSTANALVPDTLTDIAGGACFNDARVQVAKIVAATVAGGDLDLSFWVRS